MKIINSNLPKLCLTSAIALALAACSSSTENISASYVSPLKYDTYSCSQLGEEYARLQAKGREIFQEQDDKADNDAIATGVGLVLFWPALFFINSSDLEHQVASLKGDLEAVEVSSIKKNCSQLAIQIEADREARKLKLKLKSARKNSRQVLQWEIKIIVQSASIEPAAAIRAIPL